MVFEAKLRGISEQYRALDEAIRTARFVHNSCLRYFDNKGVNKYDLNKYCAILAREFDWAHRLLTQWHVSLRQKGRGHQYNRFFENCRKKISGKKGYPKFKKHQTHGSVEYKTSGWVRFVISKWSLSRDERQFQKVEYKTTRIDNLIIM